MDRGQVTLDSIAIITIDCTGFLECVYVFNLFCFLKGTPEQQKSLEVLLTSPQADRGPQDSVDRGLRGPEADLTIMPWGIRL